MGEKQIKILFQGDSITDCARAIDPKGMGDGYAYFVSSYLQAMWTDYDFTCINRGISGNRVCDLKARWEQECIALGPDILSILIGINDTWRRYDENDPTSTESYEADYREILDRVKEKLPQTKIMLLSPFVLPYPEDRLAWREDLDPRIAVCEKLAEEYGAAFVALDDIFREALLKKPAAFWAEDGVHPSPAGHVLIAEHTIQTLQKLLACE